MDIQELLDKREQLESKRTKLQSKLEVARLSLSEIDSRLREMGINPSDLDLEIQRLKRERDEKIHAFQTALEEAENIINTIENRLSNL
jgi:chromosome segregation ATPase